MKKFLIIALVLTYSAINAQNETVNWVTLDEALALQKKKPKKILIDMYTVWCGPCKLMDKKTFQHPQVAAYINKHYYAVKFNAEGNDEVKFNDKTFSNPNYDPAKAKKRNYPHQFTRYLGVRAYPTVVFIDENLQKLTGLRGVKNPQQLELYLKLFKQDDHKKLTTQEAFNEYYETFKPEFKTEK